MLVQVKLGGRKTGAYAQTYTYNAPEGTRVGDKLDCPTTWGRTIGKVTAIGGNGWEGDVKAAYPIPKEHRITLVVVIEEPYVREAVDELRTAAQGFGRIVTLQGEDF